MADKKISSFKKFSEMKEKDSSSIEPEDNTGMPLLPNNDTKISVPQSTRYMRPRAQRAQGNNYKVPEDQDELPLENKGKIKSNENVQFIGKVAKLPKNTKASKGLNFMENIKVPKSTIWYLMIEKSNNELQMIKYNLTKGFDLKKFTTELKSYYIKRFAKNEKLVKLIESIEIDADDKYSWIKNIPLITIEGKKLISIITEDLIKLFNK